VNWSRFGTCDVRDWTELYCVEVDNCSFPSVAAPSGGGAYGGQQQRQQWLGKVRV
ncbi:hypothetical protein TIFTF001_051961, partial [Ficus carica]